MAYLTRSEITQKIINVLKEFDDFSQRNRKYFPQNGVIMKNASENYRITHNETFMRNMLRKLEDNALVAMYKDCGTLTEKYKLNSKSTLAGYNTVVLASATTEYDDFFYIDTSGTTGIYMGWKISAPQTEFGYASRFDPLANDMGFNIHATRFTVSNGIILRLWKGYYMPVVGGEIGFYGKQEKITNEKMKTLLDNSIKTFLKKMGIYSDDKDNIQLTPEELRWKLINILLSPGRIILKPLPDNIRNEIRDNLISKNSFILASLKKVLPENQILNLIPLYQQINFIVSVREAIKDDNEFFDDEWGEALSKDDLENVLGLMGTAVQVFYKRDNKLIAEHREYDAKYWTTTFTLDIGALLIEKLPFVEIKNHIYTANYFYFRNREFANKFQEGIKKSLEKAKDYEQNKANGKQEPISISEMQINSTTVIILYGK